MRRFDAKPRFRMIDVVDRHGISKENITYLNRHGYFGRVPFTASMEEFDVFVEPARKLQPVDLFKYPFIVEVVGAGFDKPANTGYYSLRFPRVLKIHEDRSLQDAVSFEELQKMAQSCLRIPENGGQEEQRWSRRLRGFETLFDRSRTASPSDSEVSGAGICADSLVNRQEILVPAAASQQLDNVPQSLSKRKFGQEIALYGSTTNKRVTQE